jgi:Ca2+-binding EF-hand superfamily protein
MISASGDAENRLARDAANESSVWITDLDTPKSFRLSSRLDRIHALSETPLRCTSEGSTSELGVAPKQLAVAWDSSHKTENDGACAVDAAPGAIVVDFEQATPRLRRSNSLVGASLTPEQSGFDRFHHLASGRRKGKKAKRVAPGGAEQSRILRLTRSPPYEAVSAAVILLNAMFIVIKTEYQAVNVYSNMTADTVIAFYLVADLFCFIFLTDLVVRLFAERANFFQSKEKWWNVLDLIIVTMCMIETVAHWLPSASPSSSLQAFLGKFSMLRIIRLLRVIRFTRAIRLSNFFRELRMMVYSLAGAMKSLAWAIVLIIIFLLIFGVFFTDGVTGHVHVARADGKLAVGEADLVSYFGSLQGSTTSLYMAMSGGMDWGDAYSVLNPLSFEYKLMFLGFVTFAIFALLNVVTAVFVESAMQRSQNDREFVVQQELDQKLQFMDTMQRVFEELDVDDSGTLTVDEFEKQIQDENILSYLSTLELDVAQVRTLLTLLDRDQNGEVDIEEFVTGCLRLKGGAKSLDMAMLQYQIEWILRNIEALNKNVEKCFELPST